MEAAAAKPTSQTPVLHTAARNTSAKHNSARGAFVRRRRCSDFAALFKARVHALDISVVAACVATPSVQAFGAAECVGLRQRDRAGHWPVSPVRVPTDQMTLSDQCRPATRPPLTR